MLARRTFRTVLATSVALPLFAVAAPAMGQELPSGGTVVSGTADIPVHTNNDPSLQIDIRNNNPVITWTSFGVGAGQSVDFVSTDGLGTANTTTLFAVLNRVGGANFSYINGSITAQDNISVWLANSNGILFGPTGSYSGGSLVLTTLTNNIDTAFANSLAGNPAQLSGVSGALIGLSAGSNITARSSAGYPGNVVILGQSIYQAGTIQAAGALVNIAAANVTFPAGIGSPLSFTVNAGHLGGGITVVGTARLSGANVTLASQSTSDAIADILAVNSGAAISATAANGKIILSAKADSASGTPADRQLLSNGTLSAAGASGSIGISTGDASGAGVAGRGISVGGSLSAGGSINVTANGGASGTRGRTTVGASVSSGADYSVTGYDVFLGNSAVQTQAANGAVNITATSGNLNVSSGLTLQSDRTGTGAADINLVANNGVVNVAPTATIIAGDPAGASAANRSRVRIGTNGQTSLGNVVAKSLGTTTNNNLISLAGPITTGNLLLDERITMQSTGSSITTGTITQRGTSTGANPAIYLVASGPIATGNLVTNASAIFVDSANSVTTGSASTALSGAPTEGHVALRGGSVDAGAISAGRDAVIRAGTTFTGTTITAGDDVDVSATGNVQFTSAQSSGNATGENFTPGGAAGSGSFSVTGEATSPDISVTSSGGNIGVGGGIALAGPGNVTVNAFGSVTLASAIADNDLSGAGTLAVGTSILPSSLTINGAAQGAAVDLQASGSLVLGDVTSTAGIVDLDSTGGAISAGAVSATGGNAQLTAPGAVTTTSIGSSAAIDVDSTGGGALDLGNLNAGTTINLDTSGTVKFGTATGAGTFAIVSSITPSSITANGDITAGSVLFQSNGTVSLKNVSATAPVGSIVLIAGGTLGDIATGTLATNGGDLFATAGRDVIIGDASTALTGTPTAGNVVLYSGGKIASGALTAGDDVYAKAGTTFTGASARAGDDVVITSTGNLSLTNATASGNGTDATAFAFSGAPGTSTAFSYVAENRTGSNVVLGSTAGSVTSTGTVSAASAIDIDSSSSGALILGNLAAGTTIALDGGGALTFGSVSGGATSLAIGSTTAPSSVVSTGAIVVGSLTANTAGALSLSGANRIGTLAGVTAGGTVLVNTVSDLTVSGLVSAPGQDVTLKTTGSITLASTGRVVGRIVALSAVQNFVNNRGADAISASDHWVVYSNAPAGDTFGGLDSGNTAIWSSNLASLFPTDVSGDRYVFAYQPTLTVTSISLSKVYGTDLSGALDGYFTVSGFQPGVAGAYLADTAANTLSGTPSITSAGAISNADVAGSPYSMDIAQGSLAAERGYAIALSSAGQLTVTPKPISATVNVSDKTYDGTTTGTGSAVAGGFVSGDDVRITGGTYTFSDKNVGIDKTVTISGVSLAGADAGNYTLTVPTSTLADILAKAINALVSVDPKIYDGTTAATGTVALSGVVTGDDVGTAGTTFTFSDKNVGVDKTVNVSGTTLTGADAGNYVVSVPATALADILAKAITATLAANDKTYDGTTAATGSLTLDGVISGDSVGTAGTTLAFADKNAGTDKTVTASGTVLTGSDAGNYTLTGSSSALADILAKAITGTVVANDKVYDGTTATTGSVTLTGIVAGDTVSTTGTTFTFSDPNAGVDKTVSVSGTALAGADGGNYTLTLPATALADILKRAIEITANDASKFQGQLDPGLTYTVGGNGLVGGDTASGSLARAPGEVVGDYAIGQGTVTAGANYTITFRAGTFKIRPTPVPNALRTVELPSEVKGIGSGSGLSIEIGRLCPEDDEKCTR